MFDERGPFCKPKQTFDFLFYFVAYLLKWKDLFKYSS